MPSGGLGTFGPVELVDVYVNRRPIGYAYMQDDRLEAAMTLRGKRRTRLASCAECAHERIVEAFGPDRCFWGTDVTRMPCSYRQCVTMFTEEMPWLKGRDLERVMGGAVVDWLGWKRPAAAS